MKVIIDANAFKSAIAKVAPAVGKNTYLSAVESVKISASAGMISATATNLEDYVNVDIPGRILENGECYIRYDDLKKMVFKGNDITLETTAEHTHISGSKKSYEMDRNDLSDVYPEFPVLNLKAEFSKIDSEVLSNLKPFSAMASHNEVDGMMNAIRFDMENQRLVTLDGHRIGVWNLPDSDKITSFTVGLKCVEILKAAIAKSDRKVVVTCDNKYAMFTGEDFTYVTRCIKGAFYCIDDIVGGAKKTYDYELSVDNKELAEIAKEYKKGIKGDVRKPMLFVGNDRGFATSFNFQTFATADKLEKTKYIFSIRSEQFYKGINPSYVVDACGFLGETIDVCSTYSNKTPMYFCEGEKEVLILPVNITGLGRDDNLLKLAVEQISA